MKRLSLLPIFIACATAFAQEDLQLLPPVDPNQPEVPLIESIGEGPEITPGYPVWTQPHTWFGPHWEANFELGINGTEGNARASSLLAAGKLKRETPDNTLTIDATYARADANSILTQEYGLFQSRWDWNLGEAPWFAWSGFDLLFDQFRAYDYRLRVNGGIGYHLIKNEDTTFKSRFGAGASKEFGGADDSWVPEAVFGLDLDHQLTKKQKITGKVDYLPAWEDFTDYRLVTNVGWEVLLDEASHLSLKIGATDFYDSTPQGLDPNDFNYYVTLLWKL